MINRVVISLSGQLSRRRRSLRERWQLHQVIQRYRLRRLSSFAPGSQSADDHERVESFFPEQVRHPGAVRFARSSTVKINVLVFGKVLDFFLKIVSLNPNRALDPRSSGVVIPVAADRYIQHVPRTLTDQ